MSVIFLIRASSTVSPDLLTIPLIPHMYVVLRLVHCREYRAEQFTRICRPETDLVTHRACARCRTLCAATTWRDAPRARRSPCTPTPKLEIRKRIAARRQRQEPSQ